MNLFSDYTRSTAGDQGWTPGYLPSNGTDGDYFRAEWCDRCVRDHSAHIGEVTGPAGRWTCSIHSAGLIAYPGPGPEEWERRIVDGRLETRCTAFQACWPCRIPGAVEPPRRRPRPRCLPGQQGLALETAGGS